MDSLINLNKSVKKYRHLTKQLAIKYGLRLRGLHSSLIFNIKRFIYRRTVPLLVLIYEKYHEVPKWAYDLGIFVLIYGSLAAISLSALGYAQFKLELIIGAGIAYYFLKDELPSIIRSMR